MESYGNTWNPMEINGNLRKSLESYRNPWNPVEINGILRKFEKSFGISNSANRNSDKIGTQTQSELRQNRDTFKITKGRWKKKSSLAPIFIISNP